MDLSHDICQKLNFIWPGALGLQQWLFSKSHGIMVMRQCLSGNCLRAWGNDHYPHAMRQLSLGNDDHPIIMEQKEYGT